MTVLDNTGTGTLTIGTAVPDLVSFNTGAAAPAWAAGQMFWDAADGTVTLDTEITNVRQQIGQEIYVKARNHTGSTIVNGTVVYVSGATGNRPTIALAQGNSASTSDKIIGITTHDITNNSEGLIVTQGVIHDLNTSAFTEGDTVYLSATTPGAFTTTRPAAPNYAIHVGHILRAHVSLGVLLVSIENEAEVFNNITTTTIRTASATDNDLSLSLTAATNFSCTPTAGGVLTFTNISSATGQSGNVVFNNTANYTITKAATILASSTFLTTISATGTYLIGYYCDGTNVYVTNTTNLT
jgi:hypothetical protein